MSKEKSASEPEIEDVLEKEEEKPLHDCILCDPFEECKHTVPLHETVKSLVRGNAGVEDLFLKINELAEWAVASGITLKPKHKPMS